MRLWHRYVKYCWSALRLEAQAAADPDDLAEALRVQTTAVSPDWLGTSVGRLTASELRDVDDALALVLGL